ncbi:hypothetical protein C0995_013730, partial [Termitomyces sp. Mi166
MHSRKNKDGYFTNDDILKQADEAMDILQEDYSGMEHIFIYDNAPSHLKQKYEKIKIPMTNATLSNGHPQPLYFGPASTVYLEEWIAVVGGFFTQPDFANAPTLLETHCAAHGFKVIFLLKFHYELNPIEQCWRYAKWLYRLFLESSHENMLEKNALEALDAIPLSSMC